MAGGPSALDALPRPVTIDLHFERPSPERFRAFERFRDAFLAGDQDMWPPGSLFAKARTNVPAYADFLRGSAEGRGLPPGIVPMDTYWVFAGDEMAGEVHVRHFLRGGLLRNGGHVGYSVQPRFRNRGVATAMLRYACERLRSLGEVDALVTCAESNPASARVIEKCGGARMPDAIVEGRAMRRYLVPLQ